MEKILKCKLPGGKFQNVDPTRSRIMSRIRGQHTKSTERVLRMALVRAGVRGWRLHARDLTGNPDIFFCRERIAIFVDGCFWHGCPKCGHIPKIRTMFWATKIMRNKRRDQNNNRILKRGGIEVIRIWEHAVQGEPESATRCINMALKNRRANRRNLATVSKSNGGV